MAGVHGGSVASERSSFVGTRVPDEISKMVKTLNSVTVDKPTFRAIVAGMHGISYSLPISVQAQWLLDGTVSNRLWYRAMPD